MNFPQFTISTNEQKCRHGKGRAIYLAGVSTPTRPHFYNGIRMLALLGVCMVPCLMSYAQTQAYADYPQTRGKIQGWKQEDFPSWLSLDGQIRLRTEDWRPINTPPGITDVSS